MGGSYFSICDSIVENGLDTQAWAVDTWEGESQAGRYSERVFQTVSAINENKYKAFSTLLRMKFDEALEHFEDKTVDFLHIDGFHSYEAVSHDYQSWYPKLSENAVVLFHDTNEVRPGFGVHQFWHEQKEKFPQQSFEFYHSHGLGILFPNSLKAAGEFISAFPIELDKIFPLFKVIGDDI